MGSLKCFTEESPKPSMANSRDLKLGARPCRLQILLQKW